jgi:hypothetical protein
MNEENVNQVLGFMSIIQTAKEIATERVPVTPALLLQLSFLRESDGTNSDEISLIGKLKVELVSNPSEVKLTLKQINLLKESLPKLKAIKGFYKSELLNVLENIVIDDI